jgi:hypothetical protein
VGRFDGVGVVTVAVPPQSWTAVDRTTTATSHTDRTFGTTKSMQKSVTARYANRSYQCRQSHRGPPSTETENIMRRFHLSLVTFAAAGVGALLTLTAPAAQADTHLADDQGFCRVIGGTFSTEIFGGQTHSTCSFTFADATHHLVYRDGVFDGSN